MLDESERALLRDLPRAEQAMSLLRGNVGPLAGMPFAADVQVMAYLVHCAYRRARAPGEMLAGRPAYEAAETLLQRVLSVASSSGGIREFAHGLFERLGLNLATALSPQDALWWMQARQAFADRWRHINDDMTLTEICAAARLLDEMLYDLTRKETPDAV